MPKPAHIHDDPEQSKRFIEMATELGAEGKPEAFDRAVRKVASAKREAPRKPKKRAKR